MIHFYKERLCLNCLAKDIENAKEIIDVMEGNALIGVLSADYPDVDSAAKAMKEYDATCEGHLSVGLGQGNPAQWKAVADISSLVQPDHINQVFSAVGYTRAKVNNETSFINSLVSPSGKPGWVKISCGPLSCKAEDAIVPVTTAIAMIREMQGNSIKFFPMKGLATKEEYIAVAKACAEADFALEPTGGIDLDNLEEILKIALDAGVKKIIPHVYTSIIDAETTKTRIEDVAEILVIFKKLV